MTATIDANTTATIQSSIERSILRVVRDGMQDDVYVSGNVTKVSFVGFRTRDVTTPSSSSIQAEQQSKSSTALSGLNIALICVALLVLFLVLALFVTQRRRKREMQSDMMLDDSTFAQNGGCFVHTRALPSMLYANIEGADIVGSLANKDELALEVQAPTCTRSMTDDFYVDDLITDLNDRLPCTNLIESFDGVECLTDTLSFDETSTEGEASKYKLEEKNMSLPKEKESKDDNSSQDSLVLVSIMELNNALNRKETTSFVPSIQVEDASDEEDEYSVAYKFT